MKHKIASRIGALIAAALALLTPFAPAANRPKLDTPPATVLYGGLNVALTTSGYKFALPAPAAANIATPFFVASAQLSNRSREHVPFIFPDTASASTKFKFRVFNSAGEQVWESDSDVVSPQVVTTVTLKRGQQWRRSVRVPLVVNGAALPAGVYSIQAAVEADKQPSASVPFEIAGAPVPDTGIAGKVVIASGATETPVSGAVVQVQQLATAASPAGALPFHWIGVSDQAGEFKVKTPPGVFRVTATYTPLPGNNNLAGAANILPALTATADVTVVSGAFSSVVLRLQSSTPPPPPPPAEQGIKGLVLIGPISPVEIIGQPNEQPLPNAPVRIEQIFPAGANVPAGGTAFVWQGITDAQGRFKALTPTGTFRVTAGTLTAIGAPATQIVTVQTGVLTNVILHVDSGIR